MYQKKGRKNKERDNLVIAEFQQGQTLRAVGVKFGLSRQRIHQILISYGVETIRKQPLVPKEVLEDLYIQKQLSMVKICKLLGIKGVTLAQSLAEYGMPIGWDRKRRKPPVKQIPKDVLEKLYLHEKIGVVKLAKLLGVDQNTLKVNVDSYGLTRPHLNLGRVKMKAEFTKDELYTLYIEKKYTRKQVAEHFGCPVSLVTQQIRVLKILKNRRK
jgi:hypothetical protein